MGIGRITGDEPVRLGGKLGVLEVLQGVEVLVGSTHGVLEEATAVYEAFHLSVDDAVDTQLVLVALTLQFLDDRVVLPILVWKRLLQLSR